ncbi:MAG TPA: magnesium chelatase, partial [Patescibacteria group bacterium]
DQKIFFNSEMQSQQIKKFCQIDSACQKMLKDAVEKMRLSARAYFRILKLSRTIADLAGNGQIKVEHLAEALQYRPRVD